MRRQHHAPHQPRVRRARRIRRLVPASFRLYLGGGVVTNGINCAMLGYSLADANLVTTGRSTGAWEATEMQVGLVMIGYAGACLFVGPAPDGSTQALLAGAELKFTIGFTGTKH